MLEVVALTSAGEPLRLAPFPDKHAAIRASAPPSSFNELVPVATLEPLGERFLWRVGGGGNSFGVGRFTAAKRERDAIVAAVTQVHGVLTPEQRTRFATLLRGGPFLW